MNVDRHLQFHMVGKHIPILSTLNDTSHIYSTLARKQHSASHYHNNDSCREDVSHLLRGTLQGSLSTEGDIVIIVPFFVISTKDNSNEEMGWDVFCLIWRCGQGVHMN